MKLKKTEEIVLDALTTNPKSREDDFILYGAVLKRMGVDLKKISLYDFLATARIKGYPTFETCSRARRKIQEYRQDLVSVKVAVIREDRQEKVKNWVRNFVEGE